MMGVLSTGETIAAVVGFLVGAHYLGVVPALLVGGGAYYLIAKDRSGGGMRRNGRGARRRRGRSKRGTGRLRSFKPLTGKKRKAHERKRDRLAQKRAGREETWSAGGRSREGKMRARSWEVRSPLAARLYTTQAVAHASKGAVRKAYARSLPVVSAERDSYTFHGDVGSRFGKGPRSKVHVTVKAHEGKIDLADALQQVCKGMDRGFAAIGAHEYDSFPEQLGLDDKGGKLLVGFGT